jgi:alpha-ribazole phosphatase
MTAPLTLHLLRHGEPLIGGTFLGHQDMPATMAGTERCAAQAQGLSLDWLWSSDLSRCTAAAQKIADQHQLDLTLDPRWRELYFGDWDGRSAADIAPDDLALFWAAPDEHHPPMGESRAALTQRIDAALSDMAGDKTGGTGLIIAHAGAIRAALHLLLGLPHDQCWSIAIPYAARLTLSLWPDERPPSDRPHQHGWTGQLTALQP